MRSFFALAALVLAAAPRAGSAQPTSGACTLADAVVRADVWIECVDWKSATRTGDVVSFWTTTVARPGSEAAFRREEADGRRSEGMSTKGYDRYARKALFFEMRCEARRMRITKGRSTDTRGRVLDTYDVADPEWEEMASDSAGEALREAVCEG